MKFGVMSATGADLKALAAIYGMVRRPASERVATLDDVIGHRIVDVDSATRVTVRASGVRVETMPDQQIVITSVNQVLRHAFRPRVGQA